MRLVTIAGPGGVGKTRLALKVAEAVGDHFSDGVYFVPLAPIRDSTLVITAIGQALGVRDNGDQPLADRLRSLVSTSHTLVVLDNFEHLLPAAPLLGDLLMTTKHLTLLVTSRARLGLSGEHLYTMVPLTLPDLAHADSLAQLVESEAIRLFVERAMSIWPDFELTEHNARATADICRRLDGLPLAIELAAARIPLLTSKEMADWLTNRLPLLTHGPKDQPERLRTMRDAIAWSYDLLAPEERRLFRRLGVFVGGWTLEAAAHVCGDRNLESENAGQTDSAAVVSDVFDLMSSLVDQSLVQRLRKKDGESRFELLETIREFAQLQLAEGDQLEEIRRRHFHYYLELAEQADLALTGQEQSRWLSKLESDQGNLRVALGWACEQPDAALGLRLATALTRFWMIHSHGMEGRAWLERMLAQRRTTSVEIPIQIEAKALSRAGWLTQYYDYKAAYPLLDESLALYRTLEEPRELAEVLANLGMSARSDGDYDQATGHLSTCLELCRDLNDRQGIGRSLYRLAHLKREQGQFDEAHSLIDESLRYFRDLGDRSGEAAAVLSLGDIARDVGEVEAVRAQCSESLGMFRDLGEMWGAGYSLYNLGLASLFDGSLDDARSRVSESIEIFRDLENTPSLAEARTGLGRVALKQANLTEAGENFVEAINIALRVGPRLLIATSLEGMACASAMTGDAQSCAMLAGAATSLREEIAAPLPPSARVELDEALKLARSRLGEAIFNEVWEEGNALPATDAISLARSIRFAPVSIGNETDSEAPSVHLTQREREVLSLMASGMTDRQIAEALFISPRTVHRHIAGLYEKLGVHTRTGAVAAAKSTRLL